MFSAGNTGATVMAARGAFGKIAGVDRPALATTIPTREHAAVLVDVGANAECRPQHLVQFAVAVGVQHDLHRTDQALKVRCVAQGGDLRCDLGAAPAAL